MAEVIAAVQSGDRLPLTPRRGTAGTRARPPARQGALIRRRRFARGRALSGGCSRLSDSAGDTRTRVRRSAASSVLLRMESRGSRVAARYCVGDVAGVLMTPSSSPTTDEMRREPPGPERRWVLPRRGQSSTSTRSSRHFARRRLLFLSRTSMWCVGRSRLSHAPTWRKCSLSWIRRGSFTRRSWGVPRETSTAATRAFAGGTRTHSRLRGASERVDGVSRSGRSRPRLRACSGART